MTLNPLLGVENLRIAYPSPNHEPPSAFAVDGVSFQLQPGERLGLVGESGSGKSTIGKAAMGLLPGKTYVEGDIQFQQRSIWQMSPQQWRRFRGEAISLVFQDPMTRLDPLMTIGEHCVETLLAHQPQLSRRQAKEKAIATLEAVNIDANRWSQYPHEFSGGMRQRVAIALALLLDPKTIVADEPTTSLDVTVSAQILEELTRLCQQWDVALLLISHDLAMVGTYCDRIGVMHRGRLVELDRAENVLYHPQHPYTRSLLQAALHLHGTAEDAASPTTNPIDATAMPLLRVENLVTHYTLEPSFLERLFLRKSETIKAVDGISFDLYPGEILGLVGESGCGKSTLSRTILQLVSANSGRVFLAGQELTKLSKPQLRSVRRHMQMIFQDPLACLNPFMRVGDAIADPLKIHKLVTPEEIPQRVCEMLERVGLTPTEDFWRRYPRELSGGQQQRVAIARALITRPRLLLCDEPVSMLDASVQSQVLELMLQLKEEFSLTYLFVTHDLAVAKFLCDRIAVMNAGQIVEEGPTHDIFHHPQHPYTQKLLASAPLLAASEA
ncbi:ABC transporter ATP-binding protein [Geitlerinema sp. PCC 9228]|jgi:peptide/nickel transport system ATP-binding protein|uniref:dipeptide ABC transporter ATP-binding protein n=1 Tax=Geitlerinema sp. PCC 9228 TaxID=111611 RepID=UPI0008F9B639|nr:ABC transporter ATP-binding protein [Geitlerinema sp. PCC 9228]